MYRLTLVGADSSCKTENAQKIIKFSVGAVDEQKNLT
jgi:hypothetical protein